MREIPLTESTTELVKLTSEDLDVLRRMGAELASKSVWWGKNRDPNSETARSVIQIDPAGGDVVRLQFLNVVGVIRLPNFQLQIKPKIPLAHFLYLAERSSLAPRHSSATVAVSASTALIEVLARWTVDAAERLLRGGLRLDYKEFQDEESAVRGRLVVMDTALETLRGRPVVVCVYDELSEDTARNRVMLAALQRLARLDLLTVATRTRARAVAHRMVGIGALQPSDMFVQVDRVSNEYHVVLPLALMVLRSLGLSVSIGQRTGTAFLLHTPDLIEEGLRSVICDALPHVQVSKRRIMLQGTGISMNPDLVFDTGAAVGDVKYKFFGRDWNRHDLYQAVAFGAAFRSRHSVVTGFCREASSPLPPAVAVGDVSVFAIAWRALEQWSPAESAMVFKDEVADWHARSLHTSELS